MFDFKNKTQKIEKLDNIETDGQEYGIGKDEKDNLPETKSASFDASQIIVHAMPEKFLGGEKRVGFHPVTRPGAKRAIGVKKNILVGVIAGVAIIALLSLGGWFLIKSIEGPVGQDELVEPQEIEQEIQEIEPEEQEEEMFCSAGNCHLCNTEECLELSEVCHLEDLCMIQGYQNEEFCPDYICVAGPVEEAEEEEEMEELALSRDSDFDQLTDIEEGLWGTDPLVSDTDSDGYTDGDEIKNLYNPLVAGSGTGKLSESDLIKSFSNSTYGYSIYYPASWQVNDTYTDQVRFSSNTGEFIQVIIQENYMGYLTAKDWYVDQNPGANEESLEEVLIGNWSGVRSPDGLNIYLVNNNYIYSLIMNIGLKTELNYSTTFEMMLKSFRLFESPL